MSFTSGAFFAFCAAALLLYYLLPGRLQNICLLAASLCFAWAASPASLAVLCGEIAAVYLLGLAVERTGGSRGVFAAGAAALVAVLALLKYNRMLGLAALNLPMVLGISYYTLMGISYLADIRRGKLKAERNFIRFALFLSFFPQVSSGPIGRGGELLPQFEQVREFDYDIFATGAVRMLVGYFKKLVIADSLALAVDPVFRDPQGFSGPLVVFAAVLFTYQLYCDFSGYTDIARGLGELFGIRLRENFRRPLAARSFVEMWNRWHLSLSTWLRDYIYIPLGGSRHGEARLALAVMVVFAVSGIWHDVGWMFLVWGLLNGVFQLLDRFTVPRRAALAKRIPGYEGSVVQAVWQRLMVLGIASFCFVVFRAAQGGYDLAGCMGIYRQMCLGWGVFRNPAQIIAQLKAMSVGRKMLAYMLVCIGGVEWMDCRAEHAGTDLAGWLRSRGPVFRTAVFYAMLLILLVFGKLGSSSFIYHNF